MRLSGRNATAALLLAQLLTGASAGERCARRAPVPGDVAARTAVAGFAAAPAGAGAAGRVDPGTDRPDGSAPAPEPASAPCGGASAPALPATVPFALLSAVSRTAAAADARAPRGPAYPPPLQPPRGSLPA